MSQGERKRRQAALREAEAMLKKQEKEKLDANGRDVLRARFEYFCKGHRAYHAGEPRPRPPKTMTPQEAKEFRDGFYQAAQMARVAEQIREEIETL